MAGLTAAQVRRTEFRRSWRFGIDGREARRFLWQVADHWDVVEEEIATLRDENARLKAALRDWQSAIGVARVQR